MLPIISKKTFDDVNHLMRDLNSLLNKRTSLLEGENIDIEVIESPDKYFIGAEINGVNKRDINVDVDGDILTISVEVKRRNEDKVNVKVLYSELFYEKIQRAIRLPESIEEDGIVAKYVDGVLSLELKKKGNKDGKKIVVE